MCVQDYNGEYTRFVFNRANEKDATASSTVVVRKELKELSDICTSKSNWCYNSLSMPVCVSPSSSPSPAPAPAPAPSPDDAVQTNMEDDKNDNTDAV